MAWTQQAWRHAVAGIPSPNQATTELQWRLAVGNVPVGSNELAGPQLWQYDESLSSVAIPLPDSGFNIVTRYAVGNVTAVNLTETIDRDGSLSATLSSFTPDFDGTVTVPTFDGDLATTLSAFSASLAGAFQYRHYFNVSYSVTPTWVVREQPAAFGDLVPVISGFTVDFDGFALPPDSTQGRVSFSISGFTPDFDGTYTAPPTFSGDISLDIETFSPSIRGTSFVSGTTGFVAPTINAFAPDFAGTFEKWNTTGTSNLVLGAFTCRIDGQFTDSNATFGVIDSALSNFSSTLRGSAVLPAEIEKVKLTIDTPDSAIMEIDTPATAKLRL